MPTRDRFSVSRRSLLIGGANIVAAGTFLSALGPLARAADAKPITVGFIYAATRNDYGFNQSFAVAAKRIAQLPGVKLIEQERVPETVEVERVMESMIQLDGAKVVFPTSFGFWPFIQKLAPKYPDVLVRSCRRTLEGRRSEEHDWLSRLYGRAALPLRHRRGHDEQDRQARLHRLQTALLSFSTTAMALSWAHDR